MSAFEAIVPDNHPFHEILMKIFRKKIKRVKVCLKPPWFDVFETVR